MDVADEAALIERSHRGPVTTSMLAADLAGLGVRPGSVALVHSSLASLGWVCGGAVAVVEALQEVLGPEGTLVVPTHTGLSHPAGWSNPSVPSSWVGVIRASMPAYDAAVTPTRMMGAVAEAVRAWPGARRSGHPLLAFAALGPAAAEVTDGHRLDDGLGETSPLGRLAALDADVVLLGVGHDANTSLHLGEHRSEWPGKARVAHGAPLVVDGERRWVDYEDLAVDSDDFARLGEHLEEASLVQLGPVGHAVGRRMSQPAVVAAATAWFPRHRG